MNKPSLLQNLQAHVAPLFKMGRKHTSYLTPDFTPGFLQAGDLVIHMENGAPGHMLIVHPDNKSLIDSRFPAGVGYNDTFPFHYEIYRLKPKGTDKGVSQTAAMIAKNWIGKVKYGDPIGKFPLRQVLAGVGTSGFGKGAQGRLMKYEGRGNRPTNVICSELCVLAYQMSALEGQYGFIRLDAKYATPPVVRNYLKNDPDWILHAEH